MVGLLSVSEFLVDGGLYAKGNIDGNIPRRAKEEERRKELNRMREEAKAKRAAESVRRFLSLRVSRSNFSFLCLGALF